MITWYHLIIATTFTSSISLTITIIPASSCNLPPIPPTHPKKKKQHHCHHPKKRKLPKTSLPQPQYPQLRYISKKHQGTNFGTQKFFAVSSLGPRIPKVAAQVALYIWHRTPHLGACSPPSTQTEGGGGKYYLGNPTKNWDCTVCSTSHKGIRVFC